MMHDSYIMLLESGGTDQDLVDYSRRETLLRSLDMDLRLRTNSIRVFCAADTPTIPLPCGGLAIGHLFSRDGLPVLDTTLLPKSGDSAQIRRHILSEFWGAYVLIVPDTPGESSMTITRDPSGEVRCYYAISDGAGFLTSDVNLAKDIGIFEPNIDWNAVTSALAYPYLKSTRTCLADLSELLPGHSLGLPHPGERKVVITREWSPWTFFSRERRIQEPSAAVSIVRDAIERSVSAWSNIDTSILLELSGGLDSSIISACLMNSRTHVCCCTLTTPIPGSDERAYAKVMSDLLGADLLVQELLFEHANPFPPPPYRSVAPRITMLHDIVDRAIGSVAELENVQSLYSGGGGDTVFCYLSGAAPAADAMRDGGLWRFFAAIQDLATMHQCTVWQAGKLALKKLLRPARPSNAADYSFLSQSTRPSAPERHPWLDAPPGALPGDKQRISDLAGTQIFRDGAPRASSRALRLPLLSQPVIEACLRVPTWMWIQGGRNRSIARAAFSDRLPDLILNRRSKGGFVSFCGGVYERNKSAMLEFLAQGRLHESGLLDIDALIHFINTPLPSRDHSFMRIFDLCMIESWVRHHDGGST